MHNCSELKHKIAEPADQIWMNGVIYTSDHHFSVASAMAILGERLIFVGSDEQVRGYIGGRTKVHDLAGKTVVPGFIEGHIHLQMYGDSLLIPSIRDKTKEEILNVVREAAATLQPGEWLVGGMGWNNEVWHDTSYPSKEELDTAAPDNPVLLPRMDGHLIWVNSKAFEVCGITRDTKNPPGGEFMRTADDDLAGCAGNAAADIIRCCIPPATKEVRKRGLLAAQKQLLAYGVTSVNDMSTSFDHVEDLKELYEDESYRLRFSGALRDVFAENADPRLVSYFEQCPEIGLFENHFTVRAVKILADGSVGAQSAALYEDYSDRPGHKGTLMYSDEELLKMVKTAAKRHMQVITHAIGDRAIDQVLSAYEKALKEVPTPDHRFRIEHFQLITGASRERAKELGVLAGMQPTHAPNSASMALRRLSADRAERAYAGGMVLKVLGQIAGGSDAPVASPNPLDGIHSSVSRRNAALNPPGGFFMENAISREAALRAYTCWGAYAQFTEKDKGSLEAGKLADFVVLNKDFMKLSEDDILNTDVCLTVIGGKIVYDAAEC